MQFYNNLKNICDIKGTSITAICKKIGVTSGTPTSWKNGASPRLDIVEALARELDVPFSTLVFGENESSVLSPDEEELVTLFRLLSNDTKKHNAVNAIKRLVSGIDVVFCEDKVSAGKGFDIASSSTVLLHVYKNKIATEADFAVQVEGESMADEYHDGDILLIKSIEHIHEPEIGQNGIFVVNNDKGYFKQWQRHDDGKYYLKSLNPIISDVELSDEDVVICKGIVLGKAISLEQE